jgi:hypothetical protein
MSGCSGNICGSLPQPIGAQPVGFQIVDCLGVAEAHALRIAMTQIAFEHTAAFRIPLCRAKGAGSDAHPAADAQLVVNPDAFKFFIAVYGIFRTHCHAWRIITLLAAHGNINPDIFPFDNLNTGQGRIADPVVHNRTNEFTIAAARTFFRVNRQYFLVHYLSLISSPTRSFNAAPLEADLPAKLFI